MWRSLVNMLQIYDYLVQHGAHVYTVKATLHIPLCENMTSSTKLEVHNILHCCQEEWAMATGDMYRKKFCEEWKCGFSDMCGQTHRYMIQYHHHHHNHFTALFPGPPRRASARRKLLLDFMVLGRIIRGRHTDNPGGCHSIRTNTIQY